MNALAFHQLLHLGARLRRDRGGVRNRQLDLAPSHRVVLLLEEDGEAALHVDAAGGERPGLHSEKPQPDRLALRSHHGRKAQGRRAGRGASGLKELPAIERHGASSSKAGPICASIIEYRGSAAKHGAGGRPSSRRTRFVPRTMETIL